MNIKVARSPLGFLCVASLMAATSISYAADEFTSTANLQGEETFFSEYSEPLPPESFDDWWNYQYLLGNADGRKRLSEKGLTLSLKFVTDSLGNVTGGRDQGFTYTGSMGFDVEADLEKLANIEGAKINMTTVWRSGKSLSNHYIGNVFQTQQIYGGQNLRLYCLYWRQLWLDKQIETKLGRIAQGDDFLSRPIYWSYVQNAFDGNPVSIFLNSPMYAYPNATWGGFIKYSPKESSFFIQGGLYGGAKTPNQNRNSAHGLDWSFDYDNAYFMGMFGWRPELKISGQTGLPGNYSMGGYYVTGDHQTFLPAPPPPGTSSEVEGKWGMYWMFDQMVYSNGVNSKGDKTGITPWFVVSIAPDERVNQMPYSFYGGARWDAIIPSRKDDFLALGFVYGEFSDDFAQSQTNRGLPAQKYESVIELTYMIQVNQWFTFQPDLQYIINPGAAHQYSNAFVIGFQSSVQF
ncbi:carbohydrate porin [Cerasicoccus maritimus]|uniref:carbohydrate porin n=1 Tax=Cerasicoccus maritimus TaxID=490089 RepID=UPI0028529DF5|nr:carbohydrate porin [Cerasicoccus maritimus]